MAVVIGEEVRDGRVVLVYDNGMEKDRDTGKLLRPPTAALITEDSSIAYHRKRQEKKRAVMAQRLQELQKEEFIAIYGELAWVAAVTGSIYSKATNPKDPKQVEAARFLFSETGITDNAADPGAGDGNNPGSAPRVVLILAELARKRDAGAGPDDVIDVTE